MKVYKFEIIECFIENWQKISKETSMGMPFLLNQLAIHDGIFFERIKGVLVKYN